MTGTGSEVAAHTPRHGHPPLARRAGVGRVPAAPGASSPPSSLLSPPFRFHSPLFARAGTHRCREREGETETLKLSVKGGESPAVRGDGTAQREGGRVGTKSALAALLSARPSYLWQGPGAHVKARRSGGTRGASDRCPPASRCPHGGLPSPRPSLARPPELFLA